MTLEQATFEPLPMRRRKLSSDTGGQYRIESIDGEIKLVQADTAYQAFLNSSFKQAKKIERAFSLENAIIIDRAQLASTAASETSLEKQFAGENDLPTKRRTIVSASEMEDMMRALQQREEEQKIQATAPTAAPTAADVPATPMGQVGVTKDGVTTVQGEGFEELIPTHSVQQTQAARVKMSSDSEIIPEKPQVMTAPELPPEQELSEEEINKLLNDKPA